MLIGHFDASAISGNVARSMLASAPSVRNIVGLVLWFEIGCLL